MGGGANGVVVVGEGNAAEIVGELRLCVACDTSGNECDAPDFGFGAACAKASEHRGIGGFEAVDLSGRRKLGKNLFGGCLRRKFGGAGRSVAVGVHFGAAPAVVVDADEAYDGIGSLALIA